jgi:hypothetical protein
MALFRSDWGSQVVNPAIILWQASYLAQACGRQILVNYLAQA